MSARETDLSTRVAVKKQILGCQRCGLRQLCTAPVPFSGANPSPIVVLGEAPGKDEDATGRPFVGAAGTLLRTSINTTMASEDFADTLAYTNVVCCYPRRTPHQSEVVQCNDNLIAQLRCLQPWYVLVVGGVAISAFWPKIRIGDMRGRWWKEEGLREDGKVTWLFATWHPAAVLRSGGLTSNIGKEFSDDLVMFSRVIQDWKRPGLNLDCVKCGRGERRGRATVWEKNLGACTNHAKIAGFASAVSSAAKSRSGARKSQGSSSATSRRKRGESVIPGTLFGS